MSHGMRGPEGARARMEELRGRIEQYRPREQAPLGKLTGSLGPRCEFQALMGAIPEQPLAPMSPGFDLVPTEDGVRLSDLKAMAAQAAHEAGVDPSLFDSLIMQESSYDPGARSRAGAMGLAQLMPGTASEYGVTNPFDPSQNLRAGARYLADMMRKFGDPKLALAAYNAGPGAVARAGNRIPNYAETRDYVAKIMARFEANIQ